MRVCQPGPVAFQRSTTDTGMRREMAVFVSPTTGRPRLRAISSPILRFHLTACGSLRASRRTRSQSVRSSPRAIAACISSLVMTVIFFEPLIVVLPFFPLCMAEAHDAAAFFAGNKRNRQHSQYVEHVGECL